MAEKPDGKDAMAKTVGGIRVLGAAMMLALGAAAPAGAHGITERVSLGPGGVQGNGESSRPTISANGRFVAFESTPSNLVPGDTNNADDIFVVCVS